jgi:mono/diheme cytochrome c family protein
MNHPDALHPRRGRAGLVSALAFAAAVAAAACGPSARADEVGDPVAGHKLASAWCGNCHVVDAGSKQATATGAPTFAAIAANTALTPLALRVFLRTPHDRMPDLHLSNSETDDLIAYILSPRGH